MAAAAALVGATDASGNSVPAGLPSTADGSDKDAVQKDTNRDQAVADDAAIQNLAATDPSLPISPPVPDAAQSAVSATPQAVAVIVPAPTASAGAVATASDNDPLVIAGNTSATAANPTTTGTTNGSQPVPPPPDGAPALPFSPDTTGLPVTDDAPPKAAVPNDRSELARNLKVIPKPAPMAAAAPDTQASLTTPAALTPVSVRPATAPVPGIERPPAAANSNIIDSTAPKIDGVDPDGLLRDSARPSDSPNNGGAAVPSPAVSAPSIPVTANAAVATGRSEAAVTVADVAVTIAAHAQSGKSRFEIRLDPAELGRIDVQLNVDSRGNVSSRLIVERQDTLNLLVRDAPQLQRALQDAGLNTAGGMQFSLADQGFANRNGFAQQYEFVAPRPGPEATGDAPPIAALQGYSSWSNRNGGLDITV
jgi:flagellar hook-length control protein FliK